MWKGQTFQIINLLLLWFQPAAGVVPGVWETLHLPRSYPTMPSWSPTGAGWLQLLPGVCQAERWTVHTDVSLWCSEKAAVRLQRQLSWITRGVCGWVPFCWVGEELGCYMNWTCRSCSDPVQASNVAQPKNDGLQRLDESWFLSRGLFPLSHWQW